MQHNKEPVTCWACNGAGKKIGTHWENSLRNPPHFSLLDCLKALRLARYKTTTDFERDYIDSMIETLTNDELKQQGGRA